MCVSHVVSGHLYSCHQRISHTFFFFCVREYCFYSLAHKKNSLTIGHNSQSERAVRHETSHESWSRESQSNAYYCYYQKRARMSWMLLLLLGETSSWWIFRWKMHPHYHDGSSAKGRRWILLLFGRWLSSFSGSVSCSVYLSSLRLCVNVCRGSC